MIKARSPDEPPDPEELEAELAGNFSFKLPMPPNPFARGDKLPEGIDA